MTYNILKGGVEPTAGNRQGAILAVIREAAPDVLVLNECNGFAPDEYDRLGAWANALAMEGRLARARSGFHVALLTRGVEVLDFASRDAPFAHVACCARLRWTEGHMTVIGTHLDPFDPNRRKREALELLRMGQPQRDMVLMGDLNALSPRDMAGTSVGGWSERYLARHLDPHGAPDTAAVEALEAAGLVDLVAQQGHARATRPTRMYWKHDVPAQRIDYVFASPNLAARARDARSLDDPRSQAASDHLPVLADLA